MSTGSGAEKPGQRGDYVTVDVALRELEIHRSTLYRIQRAGSLTPWKRSGDRKVYYERREIEMLKKLQPKIPWGGDGRDPHE